MVLSMLYRACFFQPGGLNEKRGEIASSTQTRGMNEFQFTEIHPVPAKLAEFRSVYEQLYSSLLKYPTLLEDSAPFSD